MSPHTKTASGWVRALVPARVRKPLEAARFAWSAGAFKNPRLLLAQLRTRTEFARLQRALFYQRFATAILLGAEVGLYDALRSAPLTAAELARSCDIHPLAADALLRILHAEGAVTRVADRYQLSDFGALYLCSDGPASMADTLSLMAAQAAAFSSVRDGLRTGEVPAELDIFSDGGRHLAFLGAVNSFLHWASVDFLRRVELPEIRNFIVGSMGVSFSARLLQRQPRAKVTYGCLEHLVREVPRLREHYGVPDTAVAGTHSHGGDPTADTWGDEAFDLVFLTKKMILSPENRMGERFARKAFDVLEPGGVLVLWETVHTEHRPTSLGRAMEAVMDLIASPTGLVSTERSMRVMLADIGFHDVDIVPCLGDQTTFIVARKP